MIELVGKKQTFSIQKELCQENGILIHICFSANTFFFIQHKVFKTLNTNKKTLAKMNAVNLCCICAYQLYVN